MPPSASTGFARPARKSCRHSGQALKTFQPVTVQRPTAQTRAAIRASVCFGGPLQKLNSAAAPILGRCVKPHSRCRRQRRISKDALVKVNAGSLAAYMGQRAVGDFLPLFVATVSDNEIDIAPVLLCFAAVERYSGIVRGDRSRSHLCQRRDRVNFWNLSYIKILTSSPRTRLIFSSSKVPA